MELVYTDEHIIVCIKPAGALSTDEPGGVPELARLALGDPQAEVRTVHRLDRVVAGLMVLGRNSETASELSRQVRDREFEKEYVAVLHGCPSEPEGTLTDLLLRDKRECKTYVVQEPAKGVQEAILDYRVLSANDAFSKVGITLRTGRTHQIRCQFSSRGWPLVGDRKYSLNQDGCDIALWSHRVAFHHPATGQWMDFRLDPPDQFPWNTF
jgi:23S rRNA pseudouridine1911/1915/1917 synthase